MHILGNLVNIFGKLVHSFGKLVHIFGKLVHILAWKQVIKRTLKQVSRNLGPLWHLGVYNDTKESVSSSCVQCFADVSDIYIYICCKVKKWSNFCPFLKLKSGPSFLLFLFCLFSKISFSLQKEEEF